MLNTDAFNDQLTKLYMLVKLLQLIKGLLLGQYIKLYTDHKNSYVMHQVLIMIG